MLRQIMAQAIDVGDIDTLQFLMHSVPEKERHFIFSTLLEDAIRAKNVDDLKVRAQHGEQITKKDFAEAKAANAAIIKTLVQSGADIEQEIGDDDGVTPLIFAASLRNVEAVRILLDAGAKIDARNRSGDTALLSAISIFYVDLDILRALIEGGASLEERNTRNGFTPLLKAAFYNDGKVIKFLLELGADTSAVDRNGRNALHLATHSIHSKDNSAIGLLRKRTIQRSFQNAVSTLFSCGRNNHQQRNKVSDQHTYKNRR